MKKAVVGSLILLLVGCFSSQKYPDVPTLSEPLALEKPQENLQITKNIETKINEIQSLCPNDMVDVEGDYCSEVEETCLSWLDKDKSSQANGGIGPMRCEIFKKPTICLSTTLKHLHYCIDRFEYPNKEGEYPIVGMDYYQAKKLASDNHKRLCKVDEWNFAGEGNDHGDIKPYPYSDGYHRDCNICNCDKPWVDYTKFSSSVWNDHASELIKSVKADSNSQCKSWSGTYNQAGNVDEILDSEQSINVILSGGYWSVVRARVRPKTTVHSKYHSLYQLGTRFCLDIGENK